MGVQSIKLFLLFILLLIYNFDLLSNEHFRPINSSQIHILQQTDLGLRVVGARIAWVNYHALKRDFPSLSTASEKAINAWILEQFAYIAELQLRLNGIRNSPIPVNSSFTKQIYRPHSYDRAGLLEAHWQGKPIGLVDIKGLGHARSKDVEKQVSHYKENVLHPQVLDELRTRGHSNGIMSLGAVIAEMTRQVAIQMLFDIYNQKNHTSFETVESYFIIEMPFQLLLDSGRTRTAAIIGRQSHFGRIGGGVRLPPQTYFHGDLQYTELNASVDFGDVIVNDPRLEGRFWTKDQRGGYITDLVKTAPWIKAHEVAVEFSLQGNPEVIKRHLAYMTLPIRKKWERAIANSNGPYGMRQKYFEYLAHLRSSSSLKKKVQVVLDNLRRSRFHIFHKIVLLQNPEVHQQMFLNLRASVRRYAASVFTEFRISDPRLKQSLRSSLLDLDEEVRREAVMAIKRAFYSQDEIIELLPAFQHILQTSHGDYSHDHVYVLEILEERGVVIEQQQLFSLILLRAKEGTVPSGKVAAMKIIANNIHRFDSFVESWQRILNKARTDSSYIVSEQASAILNTGPCKTLAKETIK